MISFKFCVEPTSLNENNNTNIFIISLSLNWQNPEKKNKLCKIYIYVEF